MKNIILTGYMGTGKTTISKEISKLAKMKLADTDKMVEESEGVSIKEIFSKHSQEYFRDLETKACKKAAKFKNCVIATGGGAVLRNENIKFLRKNGVVFNLEPDTETIKQRLKRGDRVRPLVENAGEDEIIQRFLNRKPYYNNCDYKIQVNNNKTPKEYAIQILEIMRKKQGEN